LRDSHLYFLNGQPEYICNESDVTYDIISTYPPNLSLPDTMHRLVALNRSPSRMEVPEALLGLHPPFDRSMILLKNVIQVLDGSMATSRAQHPFLLYGGDGRAVDRSQIRINDARLWVGGSTQSFAK